MVTPGVILVILLGLELFIDVQTDIAQPVVIFVDKAVIGLIVIEVEVRDLKLLRAHGGCGEQLLRQADGEHNEHEHHREKHNEQDALAFAVFHWFNSFL